MMNARILFRLLPTLTGLLYSLTIASAQTPVDLAAALPATQSLYTLPDSPSSSVKATSLQTVALVPMQTDGLVKLEGTAFERFRVFNAQGELWIGGPAAPGQTIDLGHLPAGVYYLHLSSGNGEVVRKVLKKG